MGFAIDNKTRDQQLAWVKELGATVIRSHYPLAPYTQERADELGIMQWSEIPVYSVKTQYLKQKLVRELAARELESNIQTNGNHPSVIIWSIANELSARPGPVQGLYIKAAVERAHALDPSRPVGIAVGRLPVGRLPARVRPDRRHRRQRLLRLVPGPERPDRRPHAAVGLPGLGAPVLPQQGDRGQRVRRGGQPRRAGGGEGHLRLPAGLRQLPPRRVRDEAVAVGRHLLRAAGVPRAPRLGRRQPAARSRRSTRRGWSPSTACASPRSSTSSASSSPPSSSAQCHDPGYDDRDGRPPASRCDGGGRRQGADADRAHGAVGVGGAQRAERCARGGGGPPGRRHGDRAGRPQRPRPVDLPAARRPRHRPRGGPFAGLYVDANAVSPATADEIRGVVEAAGARYVDGGIIGGPPEATDSTTRLYLSGADAAGGGRAVRRQRPRALVLDGDPTAASALKMAYAGWTKGTTALLLTMRAAARAHGVEDALVREWEHSIPSLPDALGAGGARRRREGLAVGGRDARDRRDAGRRRPARRLPRGAAARSSSAARPRRPGRRAGPRGPRR